LFTYYKKMARRAFDLDGYTVRTGALAPDEAARMAGVVHQMDLDSMGAERVAAGDRHKHRHVRNFGDLAGGSTFAGIDLSAATGWRDVRLDAVHAYRVPSGSQGEAACWHQDTTVLRQPHVLTLIAYLGDVPDAESGATWVVPGSRAATRDMMCGMPRRPLLVGAGDVLLMDGALWHRGAAVQRDRPARTVVSAFYTGDPPHVK
jgi:hypothetical protein